MLALVLAFLLALGLSACGGPDKPPESEIDYTHRPVAADLAELEIRATGVDRFTWCPPPGELGQHWVPPPFPWTPPPPGAPQPFYIDANTITERPDRSLTEQAIEVTHRDLRSCFWKGLVRDPTQEGRVALVLRVGADGTVAKVEEYGACDIAPESIECMKNVVGKLRFPAPAGGSETITIPTVFTSRDAISKTQPTLDDSFTASAFITIEEARPELHACEEKARRELRPVQATGTFHLDLATDGRVLHTHIDPWTGDQPLLLCAAGVLERLRFAPPPSNVDVKASHVVARLNFNPRQGSR